jgi:hypothetical protein
MLKIKIAFNPTNEKVLVCRGQFHAHEMPIKSYDKWVRAIYFPEHKTIYFRFHNPVGEYHFLNQEDEELSFKICEQARKGFIQNGIIPKKTKCLFWQTNQRISQSEITF